MLQAFVFPRTDVLEAGGLLMTFVIGAVQAFLLTPYLIAVHRFVILGEVTPSYALASGEPRFQRFFGWSIVLSALWLVPSLVGLAFTDSPGMRGLVSVVIGIIFLIVSLRVIVLFPAITVDAPGATWGNAISDTKATLGVFFSFLS